MNFTAHFDLRKRPFTREISVKELYTHPQSEATLNSLVHTLEQRMSCALEAPAGLGKTAMIRALCERLPDVRYRVHYVKVTGLSKRDMSREIARCLNLSEVGTFPKLLQLIHEAIQTRSSEQALRTVLILDDAHEMRPSVMAMFKALTNFEMDSRLLLSIVLVGQLGLRRLLRRAELVDVAQRLAWYGTLRPLSRDETQDYLLHRCAIAGSTRELFDAQAVEAIYEMGHGNLRATDHLARRALEIAYEKAASTVGSQHVIAGRKTLQL